MIFKYPKVKYDRCAVIHGAWDDSLIDDCKTACNSARWEGGGHTTGSYRKYFCRDLPPTAKLIVDECHSPKFLRWLTETTGEEGLIPDPYLLGGGLHRIAPGGYLKCHLDFNYHWQMKLCRRLNLLLYLNRDWQWNGALRLHGQETAPEANTMVVFTTDDESWHGHPEPLESPEGVFRDSLALYYYIAPGPGFVPRVMTDYGQR